MHHTTIAMIVSMNSDVGSTPTRMPLRDVSNACPSRFPRSSRRIWRALSVEMAHGVPPRGLRRCVCAKPGRLKITARRSTG